MKWKPRVVYECPHCKGLSDIQERFCSKCTEEVEYTEIYGLIEQSSTNFITKWFRDKK